MDHARLHETSLLSTLEEISRFVSYSGNPAETLDNIVALLQRDFKSDVCSVYLRELDRASLVLAATRGLRPESVGRVRMRMNEGLVGLVGETLKPQTVADATAHPRFKYFPEAGEDAYHSFLGVPVVDGGLLQGVLVVQTIEPRVWSDDDVRMLMTAGTQLAAIVSDVRVERRRALEYEIVERAKTDLLHTLAGGIAHELNNKLMPVAGFAELMVHETRRRKDAQLLDYSQTIYDSVLEASRIIRQLLQLSTPSASEHAVSDLRDIVRQAYKLVQLRVKENGVSVSLHLPADPVMVSADAGQLKQVLVNLVWNAIDAMERAAERQLTITVQVKGDHVYLSCSDTGTGISEDVVTRIFDPFFTTKAPNRGTGLGLSMCLAIVRQHGGQIRVASLPDAGTTFHVSLPLHAGSRAAATPPADAEPATTLRFHGRRVLVVDDEEPVLKVVALALESTLGCSVERARNGLEAKNAVDAGDFALVLSDIRMPLMNGVDFMRWLQQDRPDVLARTVFMTGDASDSPLNADIRRAARPLVQKPFSMATLMSVAQQILEDRAA